MRKLILAPMALACLIGTAVAQQAPTMNVGNFPATQPVTQSGTWGFGLTGPIPAGSNAIGSVLADLRVAGSPVGAGNPVPVTVGNFPATQTIAGSVTANLGTLNGAALDTSVQAVRTALGSPFQAGGSIGNSAFGISGTLPAFASTPTFNLGALNGAATAANQATGNTSLASIVANTTGAATSANQTSQIAALQALNVRSSYGSDYVGSLAAGATYISQTYTAGTALSGSPYRGQSSYTKFSVMFINTQSGTGYIDGSNDGTNWATLQSISITAGIASPLTVTVSFPYYRSRIVNGGTAAGGSSMQSALLAN